MIAQTGHGDFARQPAEGADSTSRDIELSLASIASRDPGVRKEEGKSLVRRLKESGSAGAVESLCRIAREGEQWCWRRDAIAGLDSSNPCARQALEDLLAHDRVPRIRMYAARALAASGDAEAFLALCTHGLARAHDRDVFDCLEELLRGNQTPEVLTWLIQEGLAGKSVHRTPFSDLQLVSARLLDANGSDAALAALQSKLKSPSKRDHTETFMRGLRNQKLLDWLCDNLQDPDDAFVMRIARFFGETRYDRATIALRAMLQDKSPARREAAVVGLTSASKDREIVRELLENALVDPDGSVRLAAVRALTGTWKRDNVIGICGRLLDRSEINAVRLAAQMALGENVSRIFDEEKTRGLVAQQLACFGLTIETLQKAAPFRLTIRAL